MAFVLHCGHHKQHPPTQNSTQQVPNHVTQLKTPKCLSILSRWIRMLSISHLVFILVLIITTKVVDLSILLEIYTLFVMAHSLSLNFLTSHYFKNYISLYSTTHYLLYFFPIIYFSFVFLFYFIFFNFISPHSSPPIPNQQSLAQYVTSPQASPLPTCVCINLPHLCMYLNMPHLSHVSLPPQSPPNTH